MDINLTESESRYYNDLFCLCDTEKIGKVSYLKSWEFFRTSSLSNETILEINQISGINPQTFFITRTQFYSCLKLIGAYQASIPLREEILTSSTIDVPLPKFSWNMDLEPPIHLTKATSKPTLNASSSQLAAANVTANGIIMPRSPDLIQLNAKDSRHQLQVDGHANSDLPSTDSEIEQTDNERDTHRHVKTGSKQSKIKHSGSPETWSTASESPTPTNSTHNSVAERPWAVNSQSWQGLLCEEQRQLLGTEEESSDKHSSDEDEDDLDLEALYQITPEQKEYYLKQFRTVQPDINGLLSGVVARIFFEKSRIPVEELRHIWQLCDVTRDGALDLAEFTAAMHLVVLRRNNIPIPSSLPTCLRPQLLYTTLGLTHKEVPIEEDLLHLESDDNQYQAGLQNPTVPNKNDYQRMVSSNYDDYRSSSPSEKPSTVISKSSTLPKNHYSQHRMGEVDGTRINVNLNLQNNNSNSNSTSKHVNVITNRSNSNSPPSQTTTTVTDGPGDGAQGNNKEWTKFTESPTSNVSSPGPKPVNVTQSIVSDPSYVIHPVPLRVTPVGPEIGDEEAQRTFRKADSLVYESGVIRAHSREDSSGSSPKQHQPQQYRKHIPYVQHQRDSLPTDLRAIQRPHPKKPVSKNIGAIPLPPSEANNQNGANQVTITASSGNTVVLTSKKEVPPLPPPRPHRHTRSSSLDLQRIKLSNNNPSQEKESSVQPPELPPPRISEKNFKMASVDAYVEPPKRTDESFADFTHFPDSSQTSGEYVTTIKVDATNPPAPQPRSSLTSTLLGQSTSGTQRTSAFEVYRKPCSKSRNSQSPPSSTVSSGDQQQSQQKTNEYEKRVLAISDSLRQVRFKSEQQDGSSDVLKHLKEQNVLLMRLCNDLSDELMNIQRKKEEIRTHLEQK